MKDTVSTFVIVVLILLVCVGLLMAAKRSLGPAEIIQKCTDTCHISNMKVFSVDIYSGGCKCAP